MTNFHADEAIYFYFFEKENSKWPTANSQYFFQKFHGLVLGLEGLIDAKGIDAAQPIWP